MAAGQKQLDLRIDVQTPENITFHYRVAGPFRRAPAYVIDLLIRGAITLAVVLLLMMLFGSIGLSGMGVGLGLAFWFAVSWFYGGLFETYWNGQTPGKRVMGCAWWASMGDRSTACKRCCGTSCGRRIRCRWYPSPGGPPVPILPLYLVGLVTPLMNARYQRLGDLVCGTMVVAEEKQYGATMIQIKDPEVIQLAAALPANLQVSRSMGRTLAKYVCAGCLQP